MERLWCNVSNKSHDHLCMLLSLTIRWSTHSIPEQPRENDHGAHRLWGAEHSHHGAQHLPPTVPEGHAGSHHPGVQNHPEHQAGSVPGHQPHATSHLTSRLQFSTLISFVVFFSAFFSFCFAGYQRELNYRRNDGSFSAFGMSDASGSTWFVKQWLLSATLSLFIIRIFSCHSIVLSSCHLSLLLVHIKGHALIQGEILAK